MRFVVETLDSAEGIAGEIARIGPDLVLMDLRMPGTDGFEALSVIRRSAAIRKTAVIAVSASADEMTRSKVVECGFDDYLSKPVDHDDLCRVIERHLDVPIEYEPDVSTREAAPDDASDVHVPPAEVLDGLLEDLRRQSITAVRTRLDQVARTQGGDSPFVRRLRANLDAYNFKGAITFVDDCRERTT
jgi:DNA-binding response OmpR family regulator